MKFTPVEIPGLLVLEPDVFFDERGYFLESYNQPLFARHGIPNGFLQDNQSCSARGVLRGLHFQHPPFEQGKLVRVIRGRVIDVAVDIRRGSPFYGKWFSIELSEDNRKMLWMPPGFAHGFIALEDDTIFVYKCTNIYHRESEDSIRWDDPDLSIDWGIAHPRVSEKDSNAPSFRMLNSRFDY